MESLQSSNKMHYIKRLFLSVLVGAVTMGAAYGAPQNLSGSAAVNVTSDTSATAKNMAFDEARRQIIRDTVGQYADREALSDLLKASKASDLTNLIASSSIDSERLSDTTYAANITMVVDGAAARQWLMDNNVQNWLPDATSGDKFVVVVTMTDRMANWMDLQRIAREENVDLNTQMIAGNQATFELPVAVRAAFTAALRNAGWRYADNDGVLRIWK